MDRLERILRDEPPVAPTSGFTSAVMRAVRQEAAAPAALAFPWRRALAGLGASVAVCAAAVFVAEAALRASGASPAGPAEAARALVAAASPGAVSTALLLTVLLLCAPAVRLAVRRS